MSSSSSTSASTWPSWPKSTRGTSLLDVLLFKDGSITIEEDGIKTKTKSKSHDSSPSSSSSSSTMVDLLFDDLFGEKSPFQVRRRLFCCCLLALRGREMEGRGKRKEKDAVKKAMLFSLFSLACPLPKKKKNQATLSDPPTTLLCQPKSKKQARVRSLRGHRDHLETPWLPDAESADAEMAKLLTAEKEKKKKKRDKSSSSSSSLSPGENETNENGDDEEEGDSRSSSNTRASSSSSSSSSAAAAAAAAAASASLAFVRRAECRGRVRRTTSTAPLPAAAALFSGGGGGGEAEDGDDSSSSGRLRADELQRCSSADPGKGFEVESVVRTAGVRGGDRFAVVTVWRLISVPIVAGGGSGAAGAGAMKDPGSKKSPAVDASAAAAAAAARLCVDFALVWEEGGSAPMALIKRAIEKGVSAGLRDSFSALEKALGERYRCERVAPGAPAADPCPCRGAGACACACACACDGGGAKPAA